MRAFPLAHTTTTATDIRLWYVPTILTVKTAVCRALLIFSLVGTIFLIRETGIEVMLSQTFPPPGAPRQKEQGGSYDDNDPQDDDYHHHDHHYPNNDGNYYSNSHHHHHHNYPLGEEDSGALTSTINLVASAATSLFGSMQHGSPRQPPQQPPPPPEPVVPNSYLEATSSYFATDQATAGTQPVVAANNDPPSAITAFGQPPPADTAKTQNLPPPAVPTNTSFSQPPLPPANSSSNNNKSNHLLHDTKPPTGLGPLMDPKNLADSAFRTPISTPVSTPAKGRPRSAARSLPRPPTTRLLAARASPVMRTATPPGSRFRLPPRRPPALQEASATQHLEATTSSVHATPVKKVETVKHTVTTVVEHTVATTSESSEPVVTHPPAVAQPPEAPSSPTQPPTRATDPTQSLAPPSVDESMITHGAEMLEDYLPADSATVGEDHDDDAKTDKEVQGSVEKKAHETEPAAALPDGWLRGEDPDTHQTYYYNPNTGESSWTVPTVVEKAPNTNDLLLPLPNEEPVESDRMEAYEIHRTASSNTEADDMDEVPAEASTAEEEPTTEAQAVVLPNGWQKAEDPSSGRVYYFNSVTGESSWEFPATTAEVPPSPEAETPEETNVVSLDVQPEETTEQVAISEEPMEEVQHNVMEEPAFHERVETDDEIPGYESKQPKISGGEGLPEAFSPEFEGNVEGTSHHEMDDMDTQPADSVPMESPEEPFDAATPNLPEGWVELRDPDNTPYYFNTITQMSSWDLPAAETAEEETETENNDGIVANEVEADLSESHTREEEEVVPHTESTALPDNWTACLHEESGQTYYYNTATGETSWNPPLASSEQSHLDTIDQKDSSEHADTGLGEGSCHSQNGEAFTVGEGAGHTRDEATPQSSEAQQLPSDWTSSVYEETGQVYYINTVTGETSWDTPAEGIMAPEEYTERTDVSEENVMSPSQDVRQHEQVAEENEKLNAECTPEVSAGAEAENEDKDLGETFKDVPSRTPIDLPPGWVMKEDGSSGRVFYHNLETGKNSWDPPMLAAAEDGDWPVENFPSQHEYADEGVDQESVTDKEETEEAYSAWETVDDPSSGQVYYYNTETGETTWDNPFVDSEQTADEPTFGHEAAEDSASSNKPSDETDTVHIENHTVDDPSSSNYRQEEEAHVPSENPLIDGAHDDLPEGWEAMEDPDTGDIYYVNAIEGVSSWEKPTMEHYEGEAMASSPVGENASVAEPETYDANAACSNDFPNEAEVNLVEESLPENWSKEVDPDSGEPYFYNELTGETTWDKPGGSGAADNLQPEPADDIGGDLSQEFPGDDVVDVGLVDTGSHNANFRPKLTSLSEPQIGHPKKWVGRRFGASIGFGGKLCFTDGRQIVIRKLCDVATKDVAVMNESMKAKVGIHGPLVSGSEKASQEYISECSNSDPSDLLWGLIDITSRRKGRLRSQDSPAKTTSPHESTVKLLNRVDAEDELGPAHPHLTSSFIPGKLSCRIFIHYKRLNFKLTRVFVRKSQ